MKPASGKYHEIADVLRHEILSGKFESAQRFPSGEALSRRFGASRPTVERAVRELKLAGLLGAKAGSGVYLTPLARKAAGLIGVIAPDRGTIDFFTDLCTNVSAAAARAGYSVLDGSDAAPFAADRAAWAVATAGEFAARKTAGVLLEPVDLVPGAVAATEAVLKILRAAQIPVVLLDRDYLPHPARSRYDLVGIGNVNAGHRLAAHLVSQGAKSIRFLTQPNPAATIKMRIEGCAMACLEAGLKWTRSNVIETDPEDEASFERAVARAGKADAFICRNDHLAARLLQTLSRAGRKVPDDAMVAGFDDSGFAKLLNPPLTTIHQPVKQIAETAVAALLQRIREPAMPVREIHLSAPLVVRASTSRGATSPSRAKRP